jgi:hypothetical protein
MYKQGQVLWIIANAIHDLVYEIESRVAHPSVLLSCLYLLDADIEQRINVLEALVGQTRICKGWNHLDRNHLLRCRRENKRKHNSNDTPKHYDYKSFDFWLQTFPFWIVSVAIFEYAS